MLLCDDHQCVGPTLVQCEECGEEAAPLSLSFSDHHRHHEHHHRQVQSIKLSKIRVFSNAERAGLKERDFLISINGKEVMMVMMMTMMTICLIIIIIIIKVFDMDHEDVCRLIAKAGTQMEIKVERFIMIK